MDVEFLGMGAPNAHSELLDRTGPALDPAYLTRVVRAHEEAGWDHVLFAYSSGSPDPAQCALFAATVTETIKIRLAHRPNASHPTAAARTFASLDALSGGRLTVHVITGGSTADQAREGDHVTKDERYDRTAEWMSVVMGALTQTEPFSHEGRYYCFDDFALQVRPVSSPRPLFSFGGSSPAAYRVGAAQADIFALFGEPLESTRQQIASIEAAAAAAGRERPRLQIAFRPIIAPTDAAAWAKAEDLLRRITDVAEQRRLAAALAGRGAEPVENAGAQRLIEVAQQQERWDRALWTPTVTAAGNYGSVTALVGSPETVAAALLDYVELGFEIFGLRGYDFIADAEEFGREVIPLVRAEAARRSA